LNLDDTLVVLDTCVLLPPRLSDVLMDLRAEKLFSAHWTESIDDEYVRNMQKVLGYTEKQARSRLLAMKGRCPEWDVPMAGMDFLAVPAEVDQKDRHVAAAALALRYYADEAEKEGLGSSAVYLVTSNTKDMAKKQMAAAGVRVIKPGAFLNAVFKAHPVQTERALLKAVSELQRPPYTQAELLYALHRQGARAMVSKVAKKWGVTPAKRQSPAAP
jgi:hypothetical protein